MMVSFVLWLELQGKTTVIGMILFVVGANGVGIVWRNGSRRKSKSEGVQCCRGWEVESREL